jgi:hypothetical protein
MNDTAEYKLRGFYGLFTAEELYRAVSPEKGAPTHEQVDAIIAVMGLVKFKIESGKMIVVKTATNLSKIDFECSNCGLTYIEGHEGGFSDVIAFQCCPRCSCKIVD